MVGAGDTDALTVSGKIELQKLIINKRKFTLSDYRDSKSVISAQRFQYDRFTFDTCIPTLHIFVIKPIKNILNILYNNLRFIVSIVKLIY